MPACVLQMVAQQEVLTGGSGSLRFQVTDVTDGGGFASLLKGVLLVGSEAASPASAPRVCAARPAQDACRMVQRPACCGRAVCGSGR